MSNQVFPAVVRGLTFNVMKTMEFNTLVQESPNRYTTRINQSPNPFWTFTLIYDYLKNYPNFDFSPTLTYTDLQVMMGFFLARGGKYDDFLFTDPDDNFVGPAVFDAASYFWLGNFPYVLGSIIIDSGGHAQQVSIAPVLARSGSTVPVWNHTGGVTVDGGLTWQDLGTAPVAGWPNTRAQLQLVNDGVGNWYSPIQRNMGGQFQEDITDLNPYVLAGQSSPYLPQTIVVYDNGVLKTQDAGFLAHDYEVVGPGLAIPGYSWEGLVIKWHGVPTGPITAAFNFYFRVHFKTDQQDFEKFMQYLWTVGGSRGQGGKGNLELETSRIGAY